MALLPARWRSYDAARRHVGPCDAPPSEHEEAAEDHERDERDVREHNGVAST